MIRTFIALPVAPTAELLKLLRWTSKNSRALRTINPEQLHITLQFLGDTSWESVPLIGQAIAESVQGVPEFSVTLGPISGFPNIQRPRIVWAEIYPKEPIIALAESLAGRLEDLGIRLENRPFIPHLTLARVKGKRDQASEDLKQAELPQSLGTVSLDTVIHYESQTEQGRPVYEVLSEHYLH
ncbi:RNA 2',3'-cyclic phosphodiesterase [Planctomicrobium sp. SH527]|uniref:RNA 2',3'-cyclic phosphodiesterase n=1 Tax=Planctomicrobium sp. SH527 TaxID=3448123 RepID=UPI003F5BB43C